MSRLDGSKKHSLCRTTIALALIATSHADVAFACPGPTDPCEVDGGEYYVIPPANGGGFETSPALVFLHGSGGRAAALADGSGVAQSFSERGFSVLLPQGLPPLGEPGPNWSVRDGRRMPRDDVRFIQTVIQDAEARFEVDRRRILLSGFSRGGSMVWDIACVAPDTAMAYAPIAGSFWEPPPRNCISPIDLLHTHGFSDTVVPLEGRPVRGGQRVQGDTYAALKMLRELNGCESRATSHSKPTDGVWIKLWRSCASADVGLILHDGGHLIPEKWFLIVQDWFLGLEETRAEDVPRLPKNG